ncbi:phosphatidate cytidylyltransferase [bacterium]|nr:phosphatidate cytidylyltransferase [bacterium]MBU1652444.1 phosphatidate cytidylyltransferase [bacterium]MBU1882045.1 phosphatidate cytidylyltransferase [bacterium]
MANPLSESKSLGSRIAVSAWGIPLIIASIYLGGVFFSLFVAIVAAAILYEFFTLAEMRHMNPQKFPAVLFAVITITVAPFLAPGCWLSLMLGTALLLICMDMIFGERQAWRDLPLNIFGWFYIPVFIGSIVFIRSAIWDDGLTSPAFTLFFFSTLWINDISAYLGGKTWGKHKMSAYLSPNKTWEGSIIGILTSLVWAILWIPILASKTSPVDLLYVAVIVGIFGPFGDFLQSYFKRTVGVKNSGNVLGGHGGAWDRFDSIILPAILVFIYLVSLNRIDLF